MSLETINNISSYYMVVIIQFCLSVACDPVYTPIHIYEYFLFTFIGDAMKYFTRVKTCKYIWKYSTVIKVSNH